MWFLIPLILVVALIVAAVLAAVSIVLGVGALVMHHAPWLLILFGLWMLFKPGRGRHRDHRRAWSTPSGWSGPQPTVASRTTPSSSATVATAPAPAPEPKPKRELPIDLRVKVEQIRHKADVLLGYAERFPPFSHDLHIVRQTAADYLPRTVDAYLALPGTDDPIVTADGKTALEELRQQLALLDSKLDEIAQDLQREDVDRLLANRRFLEDRFQAKDSDQAAGA
jgi:hypothetical protein